MATLKEPPEVSADDFVIKAVKSDKSRKNRLLVYAGDGEGKSTFASCAKDPTFLITPTEDGVQTLVQSGQIAEGKVDAVDPVPQTWDSFIGVLNLFRAGKLGKDGGTLVIDTLNGVQSLLFDKVLVELFAGDDLAFANWSTGARASRGTWESMLRLLDRIRLERNMGLILLCHKSEQKYDPPEGKDYLRHVPALHKEIWGPTGKWTDITLFFDRVTVITSEKGKARGKALGGVERICHASRSATHDAKNRHGLPDSFKLGKSAAESWKIFTTLLKESKGKTK